MTLSGGEYAIHGTSAPGTIGGYVSHGCIRMHNADITDLSISAVIRTRSSSSNQGGGTGSGSGVRVGTDICESDCARRPLTTGFPAPAPRRPPL